MRYETLTFDRSEAGCCDEGDGVSYTVTGAVFWPSVTGDQGLASDSEMEEAEMDTLVQQVTSVDNQCQ